MREQFFAQRGIYYRTNNLWSERVTLVLIHGLSGSSSAWNQCETPWEKEFNVVSFDLRGHGKSLKPSRYEDYELEKIVDDIMALLDHLNVTRYIVLSQSYATLLALLLLQRRPEGALASVFMSSVYGIHRIFLTHISRTLIHVCARIARLFSYSNTPGRHIDYSKFRRAGDWNMRRILRDIPNTTWHVWFYCLDHAYARDFDTLWKDVRVPSLIVHGKRDSISPVREAIELSKVLPSAQLQLLDGESHVFPLTSFEKAYPIIENYLRAIAAK